jgi:hypothetical protein
MSRENVFWEYFLASLLSLPHTYEIKSYTLNHHLSFSSTPSASTSMPLRAAFSVREGRTVNPGRVYSGFCRRTNKHKSNQEVPLPFCVLSESWQLLNWVGQSLFRACFGLHMLLVFVTSTHAHHLLDGIFPGVFRPEKGVLQADWRLIESRVHFQH